MKGKRWAGDTFGAEFMRRWLIRLVRHTDVRLWDCSTAVFIIPVCLVLSNGAKTAYRYFRQRHKYSRFKSIWMTYVNYVHFSQVVIDKFALYAGKNMELNVENYDTFKQLAAGKNGFLILSAHIGCYEMAGYELVSDQKPFNALVFAGEKETVMKGRSKLFSLNNIKMIPIESGLSHLLKISQVLADNEIVSIPADRVYGSPRTIKVKILDAEAELPSGPFSIPAIYGLDVITVNVMKTSLKGYTAYVTRLPYDKHVSREQQAKQLADAYATELDKMLRRYPEQWYNYFDFWK